jgi:hypothetical protein
MHPSSLSLLLLILPFTTLPSLARAKNSVNCYHSGPPINIADCMALLYLTPTYNPSLPHFYLPAALSYKTCMITITPLVQQRYHLYNLGTHQPSCEFLFNDVKNMVRRIMNECMAVGQNHGSMTAVSHVGTWRNKAPYNIRVEVRWNPGLPVGVSTIYVPPPAGVRWLEHPLHNSYSYGMG